MTARLLDLDAASYHADQTGNDQPSLSASIARIIAAKSPAHAKACHPRLSTTIKPPTKDQQERFEIGRATHSLLLEGHANNIDVFAFPNWKTQPAQEERELSRQHGRIPLLGEKWDEIEAMVESVRAKLSERDYTPPLFTDGTPERTIVWTENGVVCKARLDWLRDDHATIDDLKTASNANPEQLDRVIADKGYDVQAAFYIRALRALTGKTAEFRFCFVEKEPPYEVTVAQLAPSALEIADAKVDSAIATWKRCLETDSWPGYAAVVCHVELPAWEEARWLSREIREAA